MQRGTREGALVAPIVAFVAAWSCLAAAGFIGSCPTGCEPLGVMIGAVGVTVALPVVLLLLAAVFVLGRIAPANGVTHVAG